MEFLFKWMSSLSLQTGLIYFIIFCTFLALLPYYEMIALFLKQFMIKKELKIAYFKFSTSPYIHIGKDSHGRDLYAFNKAEDSLITNSIINFVWKVEGAKRVDFLPIQKNCKGNGASIIIDNSIKKYSLIAYGFKGEIIESVIDFSKETFFTLHIHPIATQNSVRNSPLIHTKEFHKSDGGTFKMTSLAIQKTKKWLRSNLYEPKISKIWPSHFVYTNQNKEQLNAKISKEKVMKSYTFSTKKYQTINQ